MLANANCLLGFFFPFILQKSVTEITPIKSSAWFEFNHLFRFYKANTGKLVHFSSEKGPAIMRCDYSKGPLPTLIKKKKKAIIVYCCAISGLSDFSLLLTKDATGRMKDPANGRAQLTGMPFPSLAFVAGFCDCSVIHFWNCEVSFAGVNSLVVSSLQSAWPLPWRPHEPKHNHHWLEGDGRIPLGWGKGYQEGAKVLALWIRIFRKHCFCLVIFFAYLVLMSLTHQSLHHGVSLAPADGRVTSHT